MSPFATISRVSIDSGGSPSSTSRRNSAVESSPITFSMLQSTKSPSSRPSMTPAVLVIGALCGPSGSRAPCSSISRRRDVASMIRGSDSSAATNVSIAVGSIRSSCRRYLT